MPFFEIPPDQLCHLPLFGYDQIADGGDFIWYAGPDGRMRIDKRRPIVWLEDAGIAIQLGAIAVIASPPPSNV